VTHQVTKLKCNLLSALSRGYKVFQKHGLTVKPQITVS